MRIEGTPIGLSGEGLDIVGRKPFGQNPGDSITSSIGLLSGVKSVGEGVLERDSSAQSQTRDKIPNPRDDLEGWRNAVLGIRRTAVREEVTDKVE